MDKVSMIVMGIVMILFVIMLSPSIFAINRGKVLRNIAAWLAIFLILGLIYQNFGPGKDASFEPSPAPMEKIDEQTPGDQPDEDQGYIPPKE